MASYSYPPDSNRLSLIDIPSVGSRSYGYDGAGNTTAELRDLATTQNWFYTYDANGRLASAGYNAVTEGAYLYNALGQQVHRTVWTSGSPVVTLSVHDLGGNRIAEYDGSGTLLREYLWLDGRPLAVVEDGNTYWLHWDHILRPVMATDAAGAVVWAVRYLPFGGIDEVMADTGVLTQNLRFPGQWFQAETGLHQNWMRDYDPTTGRYLEADPLGLVDGPSVYGYARQSPVRWTDPRGEFIPIIPAIIIGALIGGGIEALDQINKYGGICFWWRILLQGSIGGAAGGTGAGTAIVMKAAPLTAQILAQMYNAGKYAIVASGVKSVVDRQRGVSGVRSMGVSVAGAVAGAAVGVTTTGLGDVVGRSAPRSVIDDLFGDIIGGVTDAGVQDGLTPNNDDTAGCGCGNGG